MIAQLRGNIAAVGADWVIVDVNGVGYRLSLPLSEVGRLPAAGEAVQLYVHTYVREDTLSLYGFLEDQQRELFEMLLGASGVGPRVALALLSVLTSDELVNAIANDEARILQRAPGVGLKLAQRIVLELKDRVSAMPRAAGAAAPAGNAAGDAVEALQSLGYKASEASQAVDQALKELEDREDTGKIVRAALRLLTKK